MSSSGPVGEGLVAPDGVSSWADRLPPSLISNVGGNDSPTRSSPRKTPLSSPVKSDGRISSPEVSPSKVSAIVWSDSLGKQLKRHGLNERDFLIGFINVNLSFPEFLVTQNFSCFAG